MSILSREPSCRKSAFLCDFGYEFGRRLTGFSSRFGFKPLTMASFLFRKTYMTQQIKSKGGVYQLIFQLALPTEIKIGSLGVQHFEPGWYGYCGSAWGSGGLASRVGRHVRCLGDNKRPHWHVDFFREYARLVEVWFAHEPAEFEHHWNKAWMQSFFTTIPVPGMGATDCEECESHFVKFHQRPMTSRLRNMTSAIANRQIYSLSCDPALPRSLECDWEQYYWTRSDILEAVKFNSYAKDLEVGPALYNLSGNKRLRELLNFEVTKGEKDFASCHEDVQLAAAIGSLIEEHGIAAHETLFFNRAIQTRKAVMQISRKSRERQHERLHSVWINDSTTVAPEGQDQAPDTMRFSKLFSRIGRARGSVMACLLYTSPSPRD